MAFLLMHQNWHLSNVRMKFLIISLPYILRREFFKGKPTADGEDEEPELKFKTQHQQNKIEASFDEQFEFPVSLFEIYNVRLVFTAYDAEKLGRPSKIGHAELKEATHTDAWMDMTVKKDSSLIIYLDIIK